MVALSPGLQPARPHRSQGLSGRQGLRCRAELAAAGLLIVLEDGGEAYDRFRDRIIFPITDGRRPDRLAFGGRAMWIQGPGQVPSTAPTPNFFDKGRVFLWPAPEARRSLLHAGGDGAALVVVEGYMDVIACQRAGIAAVAAMGTSLTENQMEMLWRLHPEPTLCFDGDRAGMQAASARHRTGRCRT